MARVKGIVLYKAKQTNKGNKKQQTTRNKNTRQTNKTLKLRPGPRSLSNLLQIPQIQHICLGCAERAVVFTSHLSPVNRKCWVTENLPVSTVLENTAMQSTTLCCVMQDIGYCLWTVLAQAVVHAIPSNKPVFRLTPKSQQRKHVLMMRIIKQTFDIHKIVQLKCLYEVVCTFS